MPKVVREATFSYKKESCPLNSFIIENVLEDKEAQLADKEELAILFMNLVHRVREQYTRSNKRCPSQKILGTYFEKRWGGMVDLDDGEKGWNTVGWR